MKSPRVAKKGGGQRSIRTPHSTRTFFQSRKAARSAGRSWTCVHTDSTPEASNGDCSYRINNASIVLMVEIHGFRFLFTGDASGKGRNEASPGTPGHIEAELLALEQTHAGTLRADVLKVPHHGSETASTQAFINAVAPRFAIISASTKHHLPRETVVERYVDGSRVVLRTDQNSANDTDHITCFWGIHLTGPIRAGSSPGAVRWRAIQARRVPARLGRRGRHRPGPLGLAIRSW